MPDITLPKLSQGDNTQFVIILKDEKGLNAFKVVTSHNSPETEENFFEGYDFNLTH